MILSRVGRHARYGESNAAATLIRKFSHTQKHTQLAGAERSRGRDGNPRKKSALAESDFPSRTRKNASFRVAQPSRKDFKNGSEKKKETPLEPVGANEAKDVPRISQGPRKPGVLLSFEESIGVVSRLAAGKITCRDPSGSFPDEQSIERFASNYIIRSSAMIA